MHDYSHFVVGFIAALVFASCNTIYEETQTIVEDQGCTIKVEATKNTAETKALSLSGNVLNASWSEGDVVTVKKGNDSVGTLTAQYSGASTILVGKLSESVSLGDVLTLCYLNSDYSVQKGSLEYIASHCDYAIASVSVIAISDGNATTDKAVFKNQQAISELSFTLGGVPASITKLSIFSKHDAEISVIPETPTDKVYVAIPENWITTNLYYFCAEVDDEEYFGKASAILHNSNYYKASIPLKKPTYPEPNRVDMGLSVEWASMNLGAASSLEYGYFYAWGETSPKMEYTIQSYALCDGTQDVSRFMSRILKYNTKSEYGHVDNKKVLEDSDDAAKVNLGGLWRMPTQEEVEELIENCTWTRSVRANGLLKISGFDVKSNITGNSIFLPINYLYNNGEYLGMYWTSSLYYDTAVDNDSNFAQVLRVDFRDEGHPFYVGKELLCTVMPRVEPMGIRPVYASSGTHVAAITVYPRTLDLHLGGFEDLRATISPSTAENKAVIWASSDESVVTVDPTGRVSAVGAGVAEVTATTADKGYVASCSITVSELESEPGIVDLGLSVRWTTCNIGASTPEDSGHFFSWGELAPKSSYSLSNYKWYNNSNELYLKYCPSSDYGLVDDLRTIIPEDDVASSYYYPMRMPTRSEWSELINNCVWEWTVLNGVNGVKITSKIAGYTDKYIFLPAAGYKYMTTAQWAGSYCNYWSSDLYVSSPSAAYYMAMYSTSSSSPSTRTGSRYYGYPIRAVVDPSDYISASGVYMDFESISLRKGQETVLNATITPSNASFKSIIWSSSDPEIAKVDENGKVTACDGGEATITATTKDGGLEASCVVTVIAYPESVDLGLPSGTLWATFNVGAIRSQDCGDYFAWGELDPKDSYVWSSYKWGSGTRSLTKYVTTSNYGRVDGITELSIYDDVAIANWFGYEQERWLIPTKEQWEELLNEENCTWTWDDIRAGYIVTSRIEGYENNRIYLPAAGVCLSDSTEPSLVSIAGGYWSSSLDTQYNYRAQCLFFNSESAHMSSDDRCYGLTIRPVKKL